MTIGEKIAERRRFIGMTQEELAKRVGYSSKHAISKMETGCVDFSVLESLSRIAGVLGLTLQDLLSENEETVQDTKQIPQAENLGDLIQELRTLIGELRSIRGECSTMSFSEKLHDLRIKAGLTQEDLAKKIGISKQNISRYENSERVPNLKTARKLADALGVSLSELSEEGISSEFPCVKRDDQVILSVGKNIADTRKALGMTQDELAARTGYSSKAAVSKIETGVNDLTLTSLHNIAQALGVRMTDLLGEQRKEP